MIRLLSLLIIAFSISIFGVATMKAMIVFMAQIFYGAIYAWTPSDLWDVVAKGSALGMVFSIFAIASFGRSG